MGHTDRARSPEERFETLFRSHYADVLGYARRRGPADVADDAAAETFLVAWRRLDELPDDPLPWLLGVTRKTLATQRRTARRKASLATRLQSVAPDGRAVEGEIGVLPALDRLPEKERELITLIAWEGLTPTQAAAVLGDSAVAVRVRLHRARRRLRRELEREACMRLEAAAVAPKGPAVPDRMGAGR